MIEVSYLLLMLLAALGGGAAVLRAFSVDFDVLDRVVISFALGIGVLGWVLFFPALGGHLAAIELTVVYMVLAAGVYFLRDRGAAAVDGPDTNVVAKGHGGRLCGVLVAVIGLVLALQLLGALAPPADADSLAYHFALPKSFVKAGRLVPSFNAVEGAIPLLQHMTYMGALGAGGEKALTLWVTASAWAASGMVFVICRRYVSVNWALAVTLVFLCSPAVIYGSGNGQVEVRNAAFVLVAAFAVARARKTDLVRYSILAGMAAGFFVASKYSGLVFGVACGLVLIVKRRWLVHGTAYGAAIMMAGSQWYLWNLWSTGDPLFPVLYNLIEYREDVPWGPALNELYRSGVGNHVVPPNVIWLFGYPVMATLFAVREFESLRVGFGPFALMVLPFAAIGIWKFRNRVFGHPLFVFGGICLVAYAIWFFTGPSQRVRHLLPLYPILLICLSVPAIKVLSRLPTLSRVVVAVFALVIPLQFAGQTLYSMNYLRYLWNGESRDDFLRRNVSQYDAVIEVDRVLSPTDRVMVTSRQLVYHFHVPIFYANANFQAVVEIHPKASDPATMWRQIRQQGISHILLPYDLVAVSKAIGDQKTGYRFLISSLYDNHCLKGIRDISTTSISSRTLASYQLSDTPYTLTVLTPETCAFSQ